ncbi:T9SS type A sorting domain-containing protein [Hymenobacter ruricola]|uniref:T9SS type A sorting domain-containing protein n=1 Tax=Hymenobacter ruricola TaxID=2791023 RepID=A0ABS0I9M0_9BACT|nr:T9SS type A sorting domain-containing protein [Hymenobacter ruricola]MBF9223660.1 T9SS type A sorting domain-containing protein [Hymenobacter ruricola]
MTTPLHARKRGPLSWALLLLAALLLNSRPNQAQTVDTYSFSASAGTFTALPNTATAVTSISSDDALVNVPIGFNFVFDGNVYTQAYVSSNGTLSFNAAAPSNGLASYDNALSSVSAASRPLVAPYWDDLTGVGGTAAYQTTGTTGSRVFTFQWLNWTNRIGTGGTFSFQVQLVEGTNIVRFIYNRGATANSGATASIGLAGTGTGSGSFLSLNNAGTSPGVSSTTETATIGTVPASGQIYSFAPPIPAACPAPRNLNAAASNSSALVTFTASNANPGPFTILYGPAGFNPALPSNPTTNPYSSTTTAQLFAVLTPLTAQTTYQFYVVQNCGGSAGDSNRSNVGTFTTEPNPAANDNCTTALPLTVAATCATPTSGTVFGATPLSSPLATSCTSTTANDVWYSFVANGRSQTITFVPQFAAVLDVRSGSCTSSTSIFCTSAAAGATSTSNVGGLTQGTTYYVRVYASGNTQPTAATSTFTLCVVTGPPVPANDECTGAVPLSLGTICAAPVVGTVVAASQSLPPTTGCTGSSAVDVWYSFVATGTTQTLTFAPQFAASLNVRTGTCAATTSVFCASTAAMATSVHNLTGLTRNQTYYVRVYASGTSQPSPTASTFILCGSGAPSAARAQANTEALLVYPNPSNTGQLTLKLSGSHGAGQATLLNALGQAVRRQALTGAAEQVLSTRGLAPGLYTLRVAAGEQVLTRKVVLE